MFLKHSIGSATLALLLAATLSACGPADGGSGDDGINLPPEEMIEGALDRRFEPDLVRSIEVLASDEFAGRGTASAGEDLTMDFLVQTFTGMGLEPGGENGTWFQEVPLVSITADTDMTLSISGAGATSTFEYATEFVAGTPRVVEHTAVENSELVFVGYGAVAPEFGWDDYAGVDVTGKTVVVLVNDPGFATQDPELFRGNAMTYYGRWTYKYEEGARQGASAVLIVHETAPAAYGWSTVQNGWTGPQFNLVSEDNNMGRVQAEGWITLETARAIFAQAGMSYDDLKEQAQIPGFQAVPMGLTASVAINSTIERSSSRNFFAKLPGVIGQCLSFRYGDCGKLDNVKTDLLGLRNHGNLFHLSRPNQAAETVRTDPNLHGFHPPSS